LVFIAYINLAHRTDRRARMETQLGRLGRRAQRIEALTPADIDPALLDRHTNRRYLEHVTPTELSCALSHHKALRAFLASGETQALILEDDAILSADVPDLLAQPLAGFDILRLETYFDPQHHFKGDRASIGRYALERIGCRCAGAAAYIVTRRAAEAILSEPQALSRPFDFVLFYPFRQPGRRLRTMQLVPALAVQEDRLHGTPYAGDVQQQADSRPAKPAHLRLPHAVGHFWLTDISINIEKTVNRLTGRTDRKIVPVAPDIAATTEMTTKP
jgi:GR25 family glycosyltransferase involved in LPS biosynthesis